MSSVDAASEDDGITGRRMVFRRTGMVWFSGAGLGMGLDVARRLGDAEDDMLGGGGGVLSAALFPKSLWLM